MRREGGDPNLAAAGNKLEETTEDAIDERKAPMHKTGKLLTPALLALSVLALNGCGGDSADTPQYPEPRQEATEIAPAVDMAAMIQTPSGLYIQDLEVGDGQEAVAGRRVTVHYSGWFLDGDKFDSSVDRGEPFSFDLGAGQVIAGWDEGVAGMRVGGWRRLVLPPALAYGEAGRQGIPPNSTLVFDVELLDVGRE